MCSADPAFTLTTPNWTSVAEAVEIGPDSNLYGPGPGPAPNTWLVVYTVPPNRLAILLTAAYSNQVYTNGVNAAIRDVQGRFYLIADANDSVNWERFPLLDENDQFVVWNRTGDDDAGAVGASFIEFDKTLPCGSFYTILRFSTFTKDSAEYTIPAGHSAILCPNNLLGGNEGDSLAKTVIFGADTSGTSGFGVENVVDSVTFFIRGTVPSPPVDGFRTRTEYPKFTSFKAGDTFRIKYPVEGEPPGSNGGLKTGQTALLVKPH